MNTRISAKRTAEFSMKNTLLSSKQWLSQALADNKFSNAGVNCDPNDNQ